MKAITYKSAPNAIRFAYPNAATRQALFHKLLDAALVTASGMGIAAILLLLMTL